MKKVLSVTLMILIVVLLVPRAISKTSLSNDRFYYPLGDTAWTFAPWWQSLGAWGSRLDKHCAIHDSNPLKVRNMSTEREKPRTWKDVKVPAWLKLIMVMYLVIGGAFMLWSVGEPLEIYLMVGFIYLAGFVAIILMVYVHGVWQLRREKLPPKPVTPKGFLKQCTKCGKEIPIASEACPYCETRQ